MSKFTDYSIDIFAITLENAFFIGLFSLNSRCVLRILSPIIIFLHSWVVATDTTMFSYVGSPLTLDFLKAFISEDNVESSNEEITALSYLMITLFWEISVIYGWRTYECINSKANNITHANVIYDNLTVIETIKVQYDKKGKLLQKKRL